MARTYTDADVIRFVTENYIATQDHIFTVDVAVRFGTTASAMGRVMAAINEARFGVFSEFKADRWSGDSFSGGNRPSTAWEPTKWTVVQYFKGDDHKTRIEKKDEARDLAERAAEEPTVETVYEPDVDLSTYPHVTCERCKGQYEPQTCHVRGESVPRVQHCPNCSAPMVRVDDPNPTPTQGEQA